MNNLGDYGLSVYSPRTVPKAFETILWAITSIPIPRELQLLQSFELRKSSVIAINFNEALSSCCS